MGGKNQLGELRAPFAKNHNTGNPNDDIVSVLRCCAMRTPYRSSQFSQASISLSVFHGSVTITLCQFSKSRSSLHYSFIAYINSSLNSVGSDPVANATPFIYKVIISLSTTNFLPLWIGNSPL